MSFWCPLKPEYLKTDSWYTSNPLLPQGLCMCSSCYIEYFLQMPMWSTFSFNSLLCSDVTLSANVFLTTSPQNQHPTFHPNPASKFSYYSVYFTQFFFSQLFPPFDLIYIYFFFFFFTVSVHQKLYSQRASFSLLFW